MNKLYILLPVHNRRKITENFVGCLFQQTFQTYHLLLIDDGSTDGTAESVREMLPQEKLTIIQGKGHWWWGGSLQQGYKWLVSQKKVINVDDFVLIINDDTTFDKDFLSIGIEILTQHNNSLLLAQCYSEVSNKLMDNGVRVDWNKLAFSLAENNEEINCLSTRGLFLRIKDFYKIGGFYPVILPHYLSDYEFTIRAYWKGFKLLTESKLRLYSNEVVSGNRNFIEKSLSVFVKHIFLKNNANNPLYRISFILLACPWRYKLKHIFCIIFSFLKIFFDHIVITLRKDSFVVI
jgi:GT2 family glycosyltransferase